MQQNTYASPIFTNQILTDSYAGRDNASSVVRNWLSIAVRFVSKLNTAFIRPQYGLYQISAWILSEHNAGFIRTRY